MKTWPGIGNIDWHRLFGSLVTDLFADTLWRIEREKDLSIKKQFLDLLIIEAHTKKDARTIILPDGLDNLGKHNLLTYKSIREPLNSWALDELLGHWVNYRKLTATPDGKLSPPEDFQLYAVATRFPRDLAKKHRLEEISRSVYELQWGSRTIRVLILNDMPLEAHNAIWAVFSGREAAFRYGQREYDLQNKEITTVFWDLYAHYRAEGLIMSYTIEEFLEESRQRTFSSIPPEILAKYVPREILQYFSSEERLKGLPSEERLKGLPPEERLKGLLSEERLKGLSPEERLKGLPPEERLKGLPSEERLKGLSVAEIKAWLAKLEKEKS